MTAIPKRILFSVAALVALLLMLNLWLWPNQQLQQSPTSFGVMRDGYKAAFDLLTEMHLPVARSFRRPKLLAAHQTVWFVSPSFLIPEKAGAEDDAREVTEWVARGGIAVVFGDSYSNWQALGLKRKVENSEHEEGERVLIKDDIGAPRWLDLPRLLHFGDSTDKNASRVIMTVDGKAFALEMDLGKNGGRLIAIADSAFLRNETLGEADASLLVADLAHAYGSPIIDERSHGLSAPSSLPLAVLDSRALLPIIMGLILAILWVFAQRQWPRRSLDDDAELPAPSIAGFVDSLAILYARASDPPAAFRAYRAGFLRRLRRQLGLRGDYPEDALLQRLMRDRSLGEDTRHWMLSGDLPNDNRRLVIAVRAIESYPGNSHENRA